ncbi:glycosyltransferase family 2 protein [Leptolyngbya ohadii]|uniref:glycosyltransferase family 2 protein n=1 Tax=Leptolyngbya ohadii TaxID=1962290 RepID=UPI000B59BA6C|nr:glycosyltransferase family 2 protein [Leptolyngbya ohadii]
MQPRITFLICTHNGERTIQQALEAIAGQTDVSRDWFEVLVVDNASSDRTSEIASSCIQQLNLNGRVLLEPRLGKVNAFLSGIQEARSELISIVDDDNFIEPGFIRYTLGIFDQHPEVGMVGSKNSLATNQEIPQWFHFASNRYACSQPSLFDIEEQCSNKTTIAKFAVIAGAGSTFRLTPVRQCLEKGYRFFNDTQRGENMKIAGEDLELCWLMYSLGYRFAFNPHIRVRHAIAAERLNLQHFRLLCRTQGAGSLGADPFMFTYPYSGEKYPIKWTWQWQLLTKIKRYIFTIFLPENAGKSDEEREFRNWVARIHCRGEIERLIAERFKYTEHIRQVANGTWTELRVR